MFDSQLADHKYSLDSGGATLDCAYRVISAHRRHPWRHHDRLAIDALVDALAVAATHASHDELTLSRSPKGPFTSSIH